ncbi:MAG: hypothetical protein ACJ8G7_10100, partial [Rhizobacter sp.]
MLQRQPLRSRQAVEPGLQDAGQRGRDPGEEQPLGIHLPGIAQLDRALVDQHLDQLFHVEGVAFCAADDELAQRNGHLRQLLQQLAGQQPAHVLAERRQVDPPVDALRTPAR